MIITWENVEKEISLPAPIRGTEHLEPLSLPFETAPDEYSVIVERDAFTSDEPLWKRVHIAHISIHNGEPYIDTLRDVPNRRAPL